MTSTRGFAILILLIAFALGSACASRDLRGWWKSSPDGKTYLVIEDDNGGRSCTFDGQPWPHSKGQRAEIEPGEHKLGCQAEVGFSVKAGMEFHFDYWGP